ncbi:MAG: type II toxin-antitoxin system RelE/ParE family toxin [Paracoccus sp. (in: a-proteobacteria)]|nr:type II toxin-antitoxin system RelE/ParE family toxin [Paracoccus sp. (in: a-proteobacteria)]
MQVIYKSAARKALGKMPAQDKDALHNKLTAFAKTGAGDVKKLKGREGYRLRHGVWRAIFTIENDVVVIQIAHRSDIYR